jgi:hypothetical protein
MNARMLWRVLIRGLIALLSIALALMVYLLANPPALQTLLLALPIPGAVKIPDPGPTPALLLITAPQGAIPGGVLAYSGAYEGGTFACAFLMELEDGRRVGVSSAHATPALDADTPAQLEAPEGALVVHLKGQIARGSAFVHANFSKDFVLWSIESMPGTATFLRPDPRGGGEPGEQVYIFGRSGDGEGGSIRWPGVVMSATEKAIWVQFEDSFAPYGYSGCPVVSQHTGRLIGMAVAGEDRHPVVMGLHPVGSLVEKAAAVFPGN